MNIRRYRSLRAAGTSYAQIAVECGVDWRTVRKYIGDGAPVAPAGGGSSRKGTQPRVIDPFTGVIDSMLRADLAIRASVVHERLVAVHGFAHSYQRVKEYVRIARERIAVEVAGVDENRLVGLHRRFETVPGAQAQVDWGDEGPILAHVGIPRVYSFHMVLSYSRDPFCVYTTSMDLGTFFACHRLAFDHFGGVPASIVYDRTKTVVQRHVAPRQAVPVHPEAAAFAAHYGFDIDVLAAYRPTGKGRVERQVLIVREHVLAGRVFDAVADMDAAFAVWVPIRRAQVHRTHGEQIGVRAAVDHQGLGPIPALPYLVAEHHLRRVGKDCLVSFEASMYSVPARAISTGQQVQVKVGGDTVTVCAVGVDGGQVLASHARATRRGSWVVDPDHFDGLPDGHTRAICLDTDPPRPRTPAESGTAQGSGPLAGLLAHNPAAATPVAHRSLTAYEQAAGTGQVS